MEWKQKEMRAWIFPFMNKFLAWATHLRWGSFVRLEEEQFSYIPCKHFSNVLAESIKSLSRFITLSKYSRANALFTFRYTRKLRTISIDNWIPGADKNDSFSSAKACSLQPLFAKGYALDLWLLVQVIFSRGFSRPAFIQSWQIFRYSPAINQPGCPHVPWP